jgi:PAS domain S-box-containing protein
MDISDRKNAELVMQNLVEGTVAYTGQDFFPALARHLAVSLGVQYALITELKKGKLHARAFWAHTQLQPSFSYSPKGTPCQRALTEGMYYCPDAIQQLFPEDTDLVTMEAQSYFGVALKDQSGQAIGVLCLLNTAPLLTHSSVKDISRFQDIVWVFAARAAAELERTQAVEALKNLNSELESIIEQRTETLVQSEIRLREYLKQSLIGLSITSPTRGWLEVNDYLLNLFGYSKEELFNLNWVQLTHPDDIAANEVLFKQALRGEIDDYTMDKRYLRKDGHIVYTCIATRCIRHPDGSINYLLTMIQDITERKLVEADILETNKILAETNRALERATRLKDDFISTVSHELRTPLNNIGIAIALLKRNPDSPRRDAYIQALSIECKREAELINDLLDLQRLEAGQRKFFPELIHIQAWLPDVLKPFINRTAERGQTLNVTIEPVVQTLVTDPSTLERVIAELLNNACKYTPPHEGVIQVDVFPTDQTVAIRVSNNGSQIPTESLPYIFDKFYRVPSTDPWKQGGTGLGLALVKQLVEELGGMITVMSEEQLTSFIVNLPR